MKPRTAPLIALLAWLVTPALAQAPPTTRPATLAEAQAFARRLHEAYATADSSLLRAAMDERAILDTALAGITLDPEFKQAVAAGFSTVKALADQIEEHVKAGGSYRLLRIREARGQHLPLFRLLTRKGFDYHELHLAVDANGQVRVVDVERYAAGNLLSADSRRLLLPALIQEKQVAGLAAVDEEYSRRLSDIQRMQELGRQGKHAQAVAVYESLPAPLRNDQAIMFNWAMLNQPLGDDKYLAALEAYRQAFPTAANADLIALSALALKGRFDESLAAVDRLDQRVGGDPHLNVFRAGAYIGKKQPAKAQAAIEDGLKADPRLESLHWALVELAISRKDWPDVAARLKHIQQELGITIRPASLRNIPIYAEFVTTPEYHQWAEGK